MILFLTSHNSEQEVIDAVKVGASAYCSKDINPDRLAYVIQSVMEGALWFDSKISDTIVSSISAKKESKNFYEILDYYLELEVVRDGVSVVLSGDRLAEVLETASPYSLLKEVI